MGNFGICNKTAIVTGAGRGIGRAIAIKLAQEGAEVVLVGKTKTNLEKTLKIIYDFSDYGYIMRTDVRNTSSVNKLVKNVIEKSSRIDILVNNAGISHTARLIDTTDQMWDDIMNVNAMGVFKCCRAVAPIMKAQKFGKIINVSSVAGKKGIELYSAYTASKHAVIGITKALAVEIAKYNVHVNAVCPGIVMTDMMKEAMEKEASIYNTIVDEIEKSYVQYIPMNRFASLNEIARCILFLASEYSDYITGEVISISGGEQ